ncbi:MAG: hypothetical protein AAB295_08450, partial [Chloroflexota bacterium]
MLAPNGMRKSCGFCSFVSDDEGLFAEHVAAVHGWGRPPASSGPVNLPATGVEGEAVTYCYGCATPNPGTRTSCLSCGSLLQLAESGRVFGHAYALNELAYLREIGLIDEATAERLRRHHRGALGLRADAARTITPAPARAPAFARAPEPSANDAAPYASDVPPPAPPRTLAPEPAGPGLFSPESAPSLLLYVGAFLIVVAALIFVNVSGRQVSGAVRLALLVFGTFGFLGVGLICHGRPRVREAGRTFLGIGALLTPLDFVAYHVLVSGSALPASTTWTLGALVSACLYAALALAGFGRIYAYLFLPPDRVLSEEAY